MMTRREVQGKTVLVVGAGKSGREACRLLLSRGARVLLSDSKPRQTLDPEVDQLEQAGVRLLPDNQLPAKVTWQLVVVSPGVPPMIPLLMISRQAGVEVIGEIELAYAFANAPFLGVTGTNGKTTTTALLGFLLQRAGLRVLVGGNIGTPLAQAAADFQGDYIVAELSSFQLESCSQFRAHVGAYLNLTPDHLDRHGDMEHYAAAKEQLFANMQAEDFAVLNADSPQVAAVAGKALAQVLWFSLEQPVADGAWFDGARIIGRSQGQDTYEIPKERIFIKGRHNMQNAMAAALCARAVGVSWDVIAAGLAEFPGVEHRLEFVCQRQGVTYINDSKGTNPDSTYQALSAYEGPILLMLGGYDKHSDFSPLFDLIRQRVRKLYLYGQSLPRLRQAAEAAGYTDYQVVGGFREAVSRAMADARSGDVVMLSPACASWDEFDNFEQRGLLFKQMVQGEN